MFINNVKAAMRNHAKNKAFTVVNVLGLGIGMAVSVLIINYVYSEFSFDKMHSKRDRIYRVESRFYEGNVLTDDWATSSFGYGTAISREITGIENFARIGLHDTEQTVSYKDIRVRENKIAYADPSFFSIFDFKVKTGVLTDQLVRPNTVVITEDVARRYFKGEDPLGRMLTFASGTHFYDCEVTGVMENFPHNSHIKYDFLISYQTLPNWIKEFWYKHSAYTYVLLPRGKNPADVEAPFPAIAEKYKTDEALRNKIWAIHLVPLDEIHLNAQKQNENEIKGNKSSLVILIVIALVILFTAWINYINLTTACSTERAKEISIRKAVGAFRHQLIRQFLMESFLMNALSVVFAAFLVEILMPAFNRIIGTDVGFSIQSEPYFWMSAIAILLAGTLVSGFYPAFIMTRAKPSLLKESFSGPVSGGLTRQVLVVFQFAAALVLICGTFIIYRQVTYMQKQDKGVDIDKTIVLNYPVARENLNNQIELFAENIRNMNGVKAVTLAGSVPGMEISMFASNRLQGNGQEQHRLYEMLTVDEYYLDAFGFNVVAGRSFSRSFGNERENLVINEATLPYLGFTNPEEAIGKKVLLEGEPDPVTIIGVVRNWHQRSLDNAYTPIMILKNGRIGWVPPRFIAIKTTGTNYDQVLKLIEEHWTHYFPDASFDYFFLDSYFDYQYKTDRRFGTIVAIFTGLAFFISVLGLWALTAYTASKRTKEMGIRKIVGAKTGDIIFLFSKEIITLILVALVIAIPVSFFIMKDWLLNYPFHTEISFWIYIAGGLVTLTIALITIGWQSWKVFTRNPVETLRYE